MTTTLRDKLKKLEGDAEFEAEKEKLKPEFMGIIDDIELAKIAQSRKNEKSIKASLDDL